MLFNHFFIFIEQSIEELIYFILYVYTLICTRTYIYVSLYIDK